MLNLHQQNQLKVLIVAYECSPVRGHAPGSAWQIISRLSRFHSLWVITEENQYKNEIIDYLKKNPDVRENINFQFIPRLAQGYKKSRPILPIISMLLYKKWLWSAYQLGRQLNKKHKFHIAHHLRSDSFREPGFIWKLPLPFVWGPTGGATIVPWILFGALSSSDRLLHAIRNIVTFTQLRLSSRVRKAFKKASVVFAQTGQDKRLFDTVHKINSVLLHEQAIDVELKGKGTPLRCYDGNRSLEIVWVGQFISRKALPIVLDALQDKRLGDRIRLHIIGDGPLRQKWKQRATANSLDSRCVWYGWRERQDVLDLMRRCDVLLFSSLLEATSASVMEALSLGLPVICLRHCGYGDVVDASCGILVEISDYHSVVNGFREAIYSLLNMPEQLEKLSSGALQKAEQYSWDNTARIIHEAYLAVNSKQNSIE